MEHAQHDRFHPVTSDDPAWIETIWFPFFVPEAALTTYARVVFQPNGKCYAGSVAIWSGANALRFEAPFEGRFDTLDALGDLRDLALPGGLALRCEASAERYRVHYEHPDCQIDVVFEATTPPEYPPADDSPGMFAGHLDQHGRVTGSLRVGGDRYAVDCGSVRDRSWGPRVVKSDLRLGNAHATGDADAFFAYLQQDADGTECVTGGTLHREGRATRLVRGTRTTRWDGNWPAQVEIEAEDAEGRLLRASGNCLNRRAVIANPELYAVLNLVEWRSDGALLYGENHDVWSRSAWLAAGRAPLEPS